MATRVYFDFEDDAKADEFFEAVSAWLTETVPAPTLELIRKRIRERGPYSTHIPRHWIYEDASACSERLATVNQETPKGG